MCKTVDCENEAVFADHESENCITAPKIPMSKLPVAFPVSYTVTHNHRYICVHIHVDVL